MRLFFTPIFINEDNKQAERFYQNYKKQQSEPAAKKACNTKSTIVENFDMQLVIPNTTLSERSIERKVNKDMLTIAIFHAVNNAFKTTAEATTNSDIDQALAFLQKVNENIPKCKEEYQTILLFQSLFCVGIIAIRTNNKPLLLEKIEHFYIHIKNIKLIENNDLYTVLNVYLYLAQLLAEVGLPQQMAIDLLEPLEDFVSSNKQNTSLTTAEITAYVILMRCYVEVSQYKKAQQLFIATKNKIKQTENQATSFNLRIIESCKQLYQFKET